MSQYEACALHAGEAALVFGPGSRPLRTKLSVCTFPCEFIKMYVFDMLP